MLHGCGGRVKSSIGQPDDELVTAHARDNVTLPRCFAQRVAQQTQHRVSSIVTLIVIDHFEIINVQICQAVTPAGAADLVQCPCRQIVKSTRIRQGG